MRLEVAERRLEQALAEQTRRATRLDESIGTSCELSAYANLQAATRVVSECDRTLRYATDGEQFAFTVVAGTTAPREARAEVARRLDSRVDESAIATINLLVSETVTNAVKYGAAAAPDTVEVEAELSDEWLRVEVSNGGQPFAHVPDLPASTDPGGRGLFLVDSLSHAWGKAHAGGRTSVWFEVAC